MTDNDISLDVIGFLEGTTKSSIWVDFLRHYERRLKDYRHQEIQILEIGIFGGASLRLWEQYFTKATVVGVDIDRGCKQYEKGRVVVEIGSQDDPEFLAELSRKYRPTIIIDDGSHMAHHVVHTFERLFPFLPPGGLYVIEDLFFHADSRAKNYLGPATITPPEYLLELSRMLVREGIDPGKDYGNWAYFRRHIDEIAFVPNGAAFIRKRQNEDTDGLISDAEAYARRKSSAPYWIRAADFIMRKGDLARADAAARKGIDLAPKSAQAHGTLSQIQMAGGDVDGAIRSAERATDLTSQDSRTWQYLGQFFLDVKNFERAALAFEKGLSANDKHFELYQGLSLALERQMKIAEAIAALRRGLAANPPHKWSTAFEQALTRLKPPA